MAKRTVEIFTDDIDQTETDVTTFPFAFDGKRYSIDLGKKNADAFRKAMAKYIEAARPVGRDAVPTAGRTAARRTSGAPVASNREQNRAIREWATANGIEVSDRGRISQEVIEQFEDAHR